MFDKKNVKSIDEIAEDAVREAEEKKKRHHVRYCQTDELLGWVEIDGMRIKGLREFEVIGDLDSYTVIAIKFRPGSVNAVKTTDSDVLDILDELELYCPDRVDKIKRVRQVIEQLGQQADCDAGDRRARE